MIARVGAIAFLCTVLLTSAFATIGHAAPTQPKKAPSETGVRTWTSVDGKQTAQATLLKFADGVAWLRVANGYDIPIAAENLSATDREHLAQIAAGKLQLPPPPPKIQPEKLPARPPGAQREKLTGNETHSEFVALLRKALFSRDYATLDDIAESLHKDRRSCHWNQWNTRLGSLYPCLVQQRPTYLNVSIPASVLLEHWRAVRPNSTTARLAIAQNEILAAWDARGGGVAGTVTEEGWKGFAEHLQKAREELDWLRERPVKDPALYTMLFIVARGQSWDRDEFDKVADELLEKAPTYFPAHQQAALYLMPRWHGELGDMEEYAAKVAQRVGGGDGKEMVARIAQMIVQHRSRAAFFGETQFDYEPIRDGLASIVKREPDSVDVLALGALLAVLKSDMETARRGFVELDRRGRPYSQEVWGNKAYFQQVWNTIAPRLAAKARAGGATRSISPVVSEIRAHEGGVGIVRFLPFGNSLMSAGMGVNADDRVLIWDIGTGSTISDQFVHFEGNVLDIAVSPTGQQVRVVGNNGKGKGRHRLYASSKVVPQPAGAFETMGTNDSDQSKSFLATAFSRSGLNAVALEAGAVTIMDVRKQSGSFLRNVGREFKPRSLAFSPDGKTLAVGCLNGRMRLFDVQNQAPIGDEVAFGDGPIVAVKYDRKGETIFAAEASGTVNLWDVKSKSILERLPGPAELCDISLSMRDDTLACAHRTTSEVVLWSVANRRQIGRLEGHKSGVTTVCFMPVGNWLASGSLDGTIRLWDVSAPAAKPPANDKR